jgi:hypothetical protein
MSNFEGISYRLANNWLSILDANEISKKKINYLEIGAFYGANLLSVCKLYGNHQDSKLYAIDPWIDYDDYSEYKTEQDKIYNTFLNNINNSGFNDKIIIKKGFSNKVLLEFEDNFFDIIYIDGNHEPEYVLEDAVLAFRKLKINGYMIFDDYGWGGPDLTQCGIDSFISGYHKRIQILHPNIESQVFIQKIK